MCIRDRTEDDAPVVEEIEKIYQHVAVKGQAALAYLSLIHIFSKREKSFHE